MGKQMERRRRNLPCVYRLISFQEYILQVKYDDEKLEPDGNPGRCEKRKRRL